MANDWLGAACARLRYIGATVWQGVRDNTNVILALAPVVALVIAERGSIRAWEGVQAQVEIQQRIARASLIATTEHRWMEDFSKQVAAAVVIFERIQAAAAGEDREVARSRISELVYSLHEVSVQLQLMVDRNLEPERRLAIAMANYAGSLARAGGSLDDTDFVFWLDEIRDSARDALQFRRERLAALLEAAPAH